MPYSDHDEATELIDPVLVRARSRIGTVLRDKWRLDVLLGVGGMAAVYAATHRNGSRVAVKILHPELSTNPLVRQRFLREGYVANTVAHEGAVKVADDDIAEDGSAFFVMELLDGETFEERRLRFGGRLGEDEVLSLTHQLLDVLTAAHAKGIVHRDLKPENVFLTRDGRVKVLDFGIARLRELTSVSKATKTGSTMGTPAFMAYEQARGLWDEVDARTDLWAVGAIMFALLSGRCVHEGRTTQEVLLGAMTKPAPPIASLVPGVSPAVAQLVDRALAQDKAKRWPDAARMQERVHGAYHDRFKVAIKTAPKLTVPETVPNRTLPSSNVPMPFRSPTTGQPVVNSGIHNRPLPVLPLAVGGGILAGVVLLVVGFVIVSTMRQPKHDATAAGSSASRASVSPAFPPPPTTTASATDLPPAITPTDLPRADTSATPKPTSKPSPTTTSAPSAAPTSTKGNCNPPYVVDPNNGKRTWKVECLP